MKLTNLRLIEDQPRWRVWIVARLAQLMGVRIHVEGIPFGSSRTRRPKAAEGMGGTTAAQNTAKVDTKVSLSKRVARAICLSQTQDERTWQAFLPEAAAAIGTFAPAQPEEKA